MIYKISVCDDDNETLKMMNDYLRQYEKDSGEKLEIFFFGSGEELTENMPDNTDILFLDMQMEGMDGIETAQKLQKMNSDFYIVIITSQIEYALKGYDIHAYSFLPKPLKYSSVKRAISDILELKNKDASFKLKMKNGTDYDIYDHKEIIYLEIYKHSLTVITDRGKKVYNQSLNELEEILRPYGFFRCHKSYLINIDRIRHLSTKELIMANGDPIPVSKYRKDELLELFLDRSGATK